MWIKVPNDSDKQQLLNMDCFVLAVEANNGHTILYEAGSEESSVRVPLSFVDFQKRLTEAYRQRDHDRAKALVYLTDRNPIRMRG